MSQKKLTQNELQVFRNKLLFMLSQVKNDVTEMANKVLHQDNGELSNVPLHMADIGSDNFEKEFTISLAEAGANAIPQIEAALERIKEGTYGICDECHQPIAKARLKAIPYAHLCIHCASELEKQQH
jgi:RNA polymerase-binding protein DksA